MVSIKYLALLDLKNANANDKKAMNSMIKEVHKEFPEEDNNEILQCLDLNHEGFINAYFEVTKDNNLSVKFLSDIDNDDSTVKYNKMLTPLGLKELELMEKSEGLG